MHTLFDTDAQFNHGDMMNQNIQRLRDIAFINLGKSQEYFRSRNLSAQNNNVIVRLLKQFKMPDLTQLSATNVRKYFDDIRNKDYRIGNMVGMVSSTSYGTISKSNFYSDSVTEILITTSSTYEDIKGIAWTDLEPIKAHRHPYDTTNYGILDKRQILGGEGIAVLSIDIPVLAVQFLQFQQWAKAINLKPMPTFQQYAIMYPIQNLIKSHNDIAAINRTIKAYRGIKGHDLQPRQAFWLMDDMPLMDQLIARMVPELKRTPRYWESVLMHMPTLYRSGYDAIRLPVDIDVRQNRWAWIIARTWLIDFLLEVEYSFNRGQKEGEKINLILHNLGNIKSDNTFRIGGMPQQINKVITAELASIGNRIKNKGKK
ncbi:hypothetical protein pEaSNUABM37_00252 [Erwinia phage pEa_SNUABM_37]|nr:hypothetical protein pEaSNUABM37_00252 [Erwinia phage pEa_SNUABM_37]QXO10720.1 hypothetical protein pEaSNUABM48_00252 [Erwinia phage pEa_SNUABM_48]